MRNIKKLINDLEIILAKLKALPADEWEVKEDKIVITKDKLRDAFFTLNYDHPIDSMIDKAWKELKEN